jgi:hypothetical protein
MKLNSILHRSALAFTMWLCACSPQETGSSPSGGSGGSGSGGAGGRGGSSGSPSTGGAGGSTGGSTAGTGGSGGAGGASAGSGGAGGMAGAGGSGGTGGSAGGTGGSGGAGGSGSGGSGGSGAGDSGSVEAPPAAGVDLLGKVAKSLIKITCSNYVGNQTSGPVPAAQTNQRNEDTFKGDPAKTYDVTFRVRGVVEPRIYDGGTPDPTSSPFVQVGGTPSNVTREHGVQYGVFRIDVSDPKQVYYLNKDHMNLKDHELYKLDYKLTVKVKGGATVSAVFSDRAGSGAIANHRNVVLEGVPSEVVMQPFKDQFMYIEGDTVIPAP